MSVEGLEVMLNAVCFGIAVAIGGFVIFMYRQCQPRFYGLLVWAAFLMVGAAFTYGLYSALLQELLEMVSKDGEVLAAKNRLAENMRLLIFVVPALMLAVAANLITSFLQATSPEAEESNEF